MIRFRFVSHFFISLIIIDGFRQVSALSGDVTSRQTRVNELAAELSSTQQQLSAFKEQAEESQQALLKARESIDLKQFLI